MYQIRDWLYVGSISDSINVFALREAGVGAVLQLYENIEHPGIVTLHLPISEGEALTPDVLARGIGFLRAQRAAGNIVMAACGAGISRSVSFATACLKEEENRSLVGAFREVRARHPAAMPDQTNWDGLCSYYGEEAPYWKLWRDLMNLD